MSQTRSRLLAVFGELEGIVDQAKLTGGSTELLFLAAGIPFVRELLAAIPDDQLDAYVDIALGVIAAIRKPEPPLLVERGRTAVLGGLYIEPGVGRPSPEFPYAIAAEIVGTVRIPSLPLGPDEEREVNPRDGAPALEPAAEGGD